MTLAPELSPLTEHISLNDSADLNSLFPLYYGELHRIATRYLSKERHENTLQPTALLNEIYLRLIDQSKRQFQTRAQFIGLGAIMMRRVLVEHARSRLAKKRGGDSLVIEFVDDIPIGALDLEGLIDLDGAIARLEKLDKRQARIVELRFFGGLSVDEVADMMQLSKRTIEGEWTMAKAWLHRELTK